MALSEIDRKLLRRCIDRKANSWEDFVDRFMGLVVHVINHTAQARSIRLSSADQEDLAADVFVAIIQDDFAILRHFRGDSSLATYLTVIARRVVVRELLRRKSTTSLGDAAAEQLTDGDAMPKAEQRINDRDQVDQLLGDLKGIEADVVRLYHLEGKSYREISLMIDMPENSVGPTLTRARGKMRRAGADSTAK